MNHEEKTREQLVHELDSLRRDLDTVRKEVAGLKGEASGGDGAPGLSTTKEFSESLIETANVIIITLDENASITSFNQFAEKLTGYGKGEVLHRNWFDLFIPERDRKEIPEVFREVLEQMPEAYSHENPVLCKNGEERLISWENTLLKNGYGNITGVLSIGNDITEQKRTREDLKTEKARFEQLFENSPEAVVIVDSDGRILRVNGEFVRLFGYTAEEALGRPVDDLVAPDRYSEGAHRESQSITMAAAAEGRTVSEEGIRYHRDGMPIHVSILGTPIKVSDGRWAYAIYRDITERKLAEEELKIEKAHFEGLFENSPEAIVLTDNDSTVLRVNSEFCRIFGFSREEAVGRSIDSLVAPTDRNGEMHDQASSNTKRVAEGKRVSMESVRYGKNGSPIEVSILGRPVRTEDGQLAVYAIYRDITERKESERKLNDYARQLEEKNEEMESKTGELTIANEKLRDEDKMKNEFISILSHDLGTSIAILSGNIELMMKGYFGEISEKQKHKLNNMLQSASYLDKLRIDTLDVSRISGGNIILKREAIQLDDLLKAAVVGVRTLAADKKQTIRMEVPSLGTVQCDPGKIRQAVDNYLSNAVRYTAGGGWIEVGAKKVENGISVWVADNGRGIPEEEQEKVFERFYRTGDRVEGSTGLGLTIVRGFIEVHGGSAWCESEGEGKGSRFCFSLPCNALTDDGEKNDVEKNPLYDDGGDA